MATNIFTKMMILADKKRARQLSVKNNKKNANKNKKRGSQR